MYLLFKMPGFPRPMFGRKPETSRWSNNSSKRQFVKRNITFGFNLCIVKNLIAFLQFFYGQNGTAT